MAMNAMMTARSRGEQEVGAAACHLLSTADDLAEAPKLDQHVGAEMVAIWAVACFGKFHPDVVVEMGLVAGPPCFILR